MKRLFVLVIITASALTTNAQFFYAQGGLNLANITSDSEGNVQDNAMLTTFNAGVMGRFGISKTIDIESGLLFTGRGSKAETYFNGGSDYIKATFNPLYLELPVNLIFNIPLAEKTGIFLNAGPYAAIGLAGKSKLDNKFGPLSSNSESDIEFSNDDPFTSEIEDASYDKLKRFDFGLNFGAGVDLDKVILKFNYGLGLTKINSTESDNNENNKNKYRTMSISVGIPFGR